MSEFLQETAVIWLSGQGRIFLSGQERIFLIGQFLMALLFPAVIIHRSQNLELFYKRLNSQISFFNQKNYCLSSPMQELIIPRKIDSIRTESKNVLKKVSSFRSTCKKYRYPFRRLEQEAKKSQNPTAKSSQRLNNEDFNSSGRRAMQPQQNRVELLYSWLLAIRSYLRNS